MGYDPNLTPQPNCIFGLYVEHLHLVNSYTHYHECVRMNLANRFLQDVPFVLFRQQLTFVWGRFEVYPSALISGVIGRGHV
jgi:hypothetical protein